MGRLLPFLLVIPHHAPDGDFRLYGEKNAKGWRSVCAGGERGRGDKYGLRLRKLGNTLHDQFIFAGDIA